MASLKNMNTTFAMLKTFRKPPSYVKGSSPVALYNDSDEEPALRTATPDRLNRQMSCADGRRLLSAGAAAFPLKTDDAIISNEERLSITAQCRCGVSPRSVLRYLTYFIHSIVRQRRCHAIFDIFNYLYSFIDENHVVLKRPALPHA